MGIAVMINGFYLTPECEKLEENGDEEQAVDEEGQPVSEIPPQEGQFWE